MNIRGAEFQFPGILYSWQSAIVVGSRKVQICRLPAGRVSCLPESASFYQWFYGGFPSAEGPEENIRFTTAPFLENIVAERAGCFGVEDPLLPEEAECVGVEHFSPLVAIITCSIAAGEEMGE